jgi:ketosteroid isomerase-like protein
MWPGASRLKMMAMTVISLLALLTDASAQVPSALLCTSPEYRQFDFWIGDWDVFEPDSSTSTAHVRINRILGGCALREHYEDNSGAVGESFTTYDIGRKLWHQTWVTNRGRLLTIEGGPEHGAILLAGAYYREDGQEVRVRGTWTPMGSTVRESAVTSSDGGRTWQPWFDLSFRPRTTADKTFESDASTVAHLDAQFQASVKANDVDAMDKILADDFILVTGSGKIFNKQQSLDEARSRSTIYEHQEDTDRIVRVWGDTAVVTAKLWIKGVRDGKPIDYTLWFSDTYVRTPGGWKYVFGQASLPIRSAS